MSPLCKQDVSAIYRLQERLIDQDRKGKEKEQPQPAKRKLEFQDFEELSSSDEEFPTEPASSAPAPEEIYVSNPRASTYRDTWVVT